jgi:hypothetical protein
MRAGRTFSIARNRAVAVAPQLESRLGSHVKPPILVSALTALAQRAPAAKRSPEALLSRATKEYLKVKFAAPDAPAPTILTLLCHHGFDHRKAVLERVRAMLCSALPPGALDSCGGMHGNDRAFERVVREKVREAIKAKKRDSRLHPDRVALELLRQHFMPLRGDRARLPRSKA